jgi:hypothetical protein
MVQGRQELRFALETGNAIPPGSSVKGLWQRLDGDVASQFRIARAIHLAHPAGPERPDDFVDADAGAGNQRHVEKV